jgi:hypothetical protein
VADAVTSPDDVFPQNAQQSPLIASDDMSPFIIVTPTDHYHRGRLYNVTLYGDGEFNGFIIQARELQSSHTPPDKPGSFIAMPPGVAVMDCGTGSGSNTAFSTDTSPKKSVTLTWKYPVFDMGPIDFFATFVQNNTYWAKVETISTPFAILDLKFCGKTTSCYRYSATSEACTAKECDFMFVSEVDPEHVVFTMIGKIPERNGYIGAAFTNEKFGKLELFACVKTANFVTTVKHYVAQDIESQPKEQFLDLESTATSYGSNGGPVRCHFRRKLQKPESQLSDFTQPQTVMFLRGPLTQTSGT